VTALRNGTSATLTTTTTPTGSTTPVTTTTTVDVPTKPMGWGNVKIALALAQKTLLAAGITQPTPAQLQAALNGGDVTVTTGTVPRRRRRPRTSTACSRNARAEWGGDRSRRRTAPSSAPS
jgi:hypothetical protein